MTVKQIFNTSAELDYPTVLPTLDLDFANSKTLDPRITFTRASGGSYVGTDGYIKFAGVNEARFDHNPITGESLGLLIEEARTNLFEWSETFVSGWGGSLSSVLNADTILNPYGVLGTVYYITGSEWTRVFNANGLSTLALSFFTKRRFGGLNRDFSTIEIFQQAIGGGSLGSYNFRFDGNNPNSGQFQNIRTERYQNDWYRFSCTLVARPDYNGGVFGTGARVDLEGGVADNYFWGIQVESGAFATSYIPTTTGSTRTRAVDSAQITGKSFSDFFNPTEGTVYVDFTAKTLDGIVLNVDDGGFPNRIQFSNGGGMAYVRNNIVIINNTTPGTFFGPNFKYATSYSNNKYVIARNGAFVSFPLNTEIRGPVPSGIANMRIGSYHANAFKANGPIRRVSYYPKALPSSSLQSLTS